MNSTDKGVAVVVDVKGKTIGKVSIKNLITAIAHSSRDNKGAHYK